MWPLPKPNYSAATSFEKCASKIKNKNLKSRMDKIAEAITDAADAYDDAADKTELYLTALSTDVDGVVSGAEMKDLYDYRMVKSTAPGRVVYDSIMALAPHGRCPFCGHRVVSTLDHILSKAHFATLTVTPNNLVPSCADCNKAKLDAIASQAADQYVHPYYDQIENDLWLGAVVLETAPAAVQFYVQAPGHWSPLTAARVQNQFNRLGLAKLYAAQAAEELSGIRLQLQNLYWRAGHDAVRQHLEEVHISRSLARCNSWQTAFYKAVSVSTWYCGGGFN